MATIEGAGVPLAYAESGSGPTVLLIHGMAADRSVWADAAAALAGDARVISYDRRGYGGSGAPEPYERTTVAEQAEDAAALLEALGAAPAVACGVDIGALAILDLLLRRPGLVRAAVLVDVPAFQLVPEANEALAAERALLEEALRAGGPEAAVAAWLADRGIARAPASPRAFFADFGGQSTLPLTRRGLRGIEVPAAVIDGPAAPPHVRAAGDAVARLLPGARRRGAEAPAESVRSLMVPT